MAAGYDGAYRAFPPKCELDALTSGAIAACDPQDGVTDGIISDGLTPLPAPSIPSAWSVRLPTALPITKLPRSATQLPPSPILPGRGPGKLTEISSITVSITKLDSLAPQETRPLLQIWALHLRVAIRMEFVYEYLLDSEKPG
jgi:hypothetical protein